MTAAAPTPARSTSGGPSRVLLVRTSALGDVVHALPVLTALRRHLPAARLGWVVEESMAPLLAGHPDLDDLIVVALRRWRLRPLAAATVRDLRRFLDALDRFAPDLVLDLMGNHKGGVIAALTLADRRAGLARGDRREPSSALWLNEAVSAAASGPHAVDRMLALLAAAGLPPEPADFGAAKLFSTVPEPARLLLAAAPPTGFAILHPGAGWANKRYPPAWWGEAVHLLHRATGVPTWVASGPGEEDLAQAVEAAARGSARAVPAGDLPTLAALRRAARLGLGGDSGPLHLAHALSTPVLMLMGPTDPDRNGPYQAPHRALVHRLPCSFCHRRFDGARPCLLNITPREVAAHAAKLMRE